jgi:hypothetical protein
VGLTCAAVGLSALAGIVVSLLLGKIVPGAKPAWTMLGFEIITLVSAVLGVLFAAGRFRDAPAMALVCVAGTVFSAAVCAHIGVHGELGRFSIVPLTGGRVLAAALLAALGGTCVLVRDPASWRVFLKGAILGLPMLIGVGVLAATRGAIIDRLGALGSTGKIAVIGVYALVAGGMLCASVEFVVRAFRMGVIPDAADESSKS